MTESRIRELLNRSWPDISWFAISVLEEVHRDERYFSFLANGETKRRRVVFAAGLISERGEGIIFLRREKEEEVLVFTVKGWVLAPSPVVLPIISLKMLLRRM